MSETIQYIIRFLAGADIPENELQRIGYTSDVTEYPKYSIVIQPSDFFDANVYGTKESLPSLPLKIWEEVPILFGEPVIEKVDNTLVLKADIVAGTYFLISRYEEMIRKDVRDTHGRFPGKESLPYRAGFIDRPIIEEWGTLFRQVLRDAGFTIPETEKKIQKIYLTHDVDQMAHFRNIRGMLGGFLRGIRWPKEGQKALRSFFGNLKYDPWYTFPFLYKLDTGLINVLGNERCETISFFRAGGGKTREDKPVSNLLLPDYKTLINYTKRKNITIGLHSSYLAGKNPEVIKSEKQKLDKITNKISTYNRHHFLGSREPGDMQALVDVGITDDFTMGYADMAGFRLGTCRPVKWINPETQKLSELLLHGLTIMDSSLSDKRYMYMNAHEAFHYCEQLINTVEGYNGELVLLWHNTSVEKRPDSYHRKLYRDIILLLQKK